MNEADRFRERRTDLCAKAIEAAPDEGMWWAELAPLNRIERLVVMREVTRRRLAKLNTETEG